MHAQADIAHIGLGWISGLSGVLEGASFPGLIAEWTRPLAVRVIPDGVHSSLPHTGIGRD